MRNAPSLIVFVVMAMQTPRVSAFGERIGVHVALAIIFALFLTLSTFTLAFFQGRTSNYIITADKKSDAEKRAYLAQAKMAELFKEIYWHSTVWLLLFVVIEGALNLSETMAELKETVAVMDWEWFGAIAYGIFPTLATLGMGKLQSLVSKMPHGSTGASQMDKVFDAFLRWAEGKFLEESDGKVSGKFPNEEGKVSGKFPSDWRKVRPLLSDTDVVWLSKAKTGDICYKYGVIEKTARNWRGYALEEVGVATTTAKKAAVEADSAK